MARKQFFCSAWLACCSCVHWMCSLCVFPMSFTVTIQKSHSAVTQASGTVKPGIFTCHTMVLKAINDNIAQTKGVRKKIWEIMSSSNFFALFDVLIYCLLKFTDHLHCHTFFSGYSLYTLNYSWNFFHFDSITQFYNKFHAVVMILPWNVLFNDALICKFALHRWLMNERVCSIDGKMLIGENRSPRRETCPCGLQCKSRMNWAGTKPGTPRWKWAANTYLLSSQFLAPKS
jgi:hypothetical protein